MFFGENEGIKKSGKSIKGNPTFKMFYRTLMKLNLLSSFLGVLHNRPNKVIIQFLRLL